MSSNNRPVISRWPTSMSMGTKLPNVAQTMPPILPSRRKFPRPSSHYNGTFAQRMAKTKHDIEELFKLYYANNIQFDTFERQIVTGTRIPSARTSSLVQPIHTDSSSSVFNSRHCVSRELLNAAVDPKGEPKEAVIKKCVHVRIETNGSLPPLEHTPSPRPTQSENPSSSLSHWHLVTPEKTSDELHESLLVKSSTSFDDLAGDSVEHLYLKRYKPMHSHRPNSLKSNSPLFPPVPPPSLLLANPSRDPNEASRSSFSTSQTLDQRQPSPIVTGRAVIVRPRTANKSVRVRPKSSSTPRISPLSSKKSALSIVTASNQSDVSESSSYLNAQRVVSIPSKCSRYVLVSLPKARVRYNAPTYMERLLLPERFPTLFQNIVHSYEH